MRLNKLVFFLLLGVISFYTKGQNKYSLGIEGSVGICTLGRSYGNYLCDDA